MSGSWTAGSTHLQGSVVLGKPNLASKHRLFFLFQNVSTQSIGHLQLRNNIRYKHTAIEQVSNTVEHSITSKNFNNSTKNSFILIRAFKQGRNSLGSNLVGHGNEFE